MRVKTFALAALVLGLASCQREPEGLDVNLGTEVDTSITVAIPGNNTRAGGADSAEGIFANGLLTDTGSDLTMRYILQVYYMGEPSEERQVVYSDDSSVTFDIRLIPNRDYTFVVWADVVTEQGKVNGQYSSADDLHYNTSDLAAITLNNTWAAMDETRDAFTATKEVAGYNGQTSLNIELTRPFGKLRVKTTDLKELTDIGVTPQYATVSYTTPYRPGFNAVEGKAFAAGTSKKEHTIFAIAPYTNEANDEHNLTLFTDYLFAEEGDAVSFTLDVYEDEQMQKLIKSNNFNTDIAINRNHLTTIYGNILTDGNKITVIVKDEGAFDNSTEINHITDGVTLGNNDTYHVYNSNGLMWIAKQVNSGEAITSVMLNADIDFSSTPWTPIGTADAPFNGTFNGNGYKISNLTIANTDYAAFIAYADDGAKVEDLTLENVNINSTKHAAGVVCMGGTGVILEDITVSGTISANNYAGGICHNMDSVIIMRCVNNATVSAQRAAGIASWAATNANIQDVENNGDITGSIGASGIAHGFAGTMNGAVNHGTITATGSEPAAGIAGVQKGASTYSYCTNYGDITSTADNPNSSAAGILGHTPGSKATFTYCANFGDITAEQSYAAGIAYSLYGQIDANYCYNKGAIFGADAAGAIAPKAQYGTADKASYCLNDGAITSSGTTYQAANNSTSCYYYNNGELLNVGNNAVVSTDDALASLNGGSDANFFEVENGVITVM